MVKLLIWSPWPHFSCVHSRPTCRSSDWESPWCFARPPSPERLRYVHSTSVRQRTSEILRCLCRNSVLRSPRNARLKIKWRNIIFKLWRHHYVFIMSERQQTSAIFRCLNIFQVTSRLCVRCALVRQQTLTICAWLLWWQVRICACPHQNTLT